ncbi:MAG: DUF4259 domain-containing protein [Verrucomicrobia bacterium]|nr:DUF4259 domain-containing protein [Verrucomicrobiota bacterium]
MGSWGTAPWDNDAAADWFAQMFEKTKLAKYVEKSLKKDPEDEPEEVRAAAYMLVALGRNFIWPIDDIDRQLKLAISKLEAVREVYSEAAPELVAQLEVEIAALRSHMTPSD